MCFYVTPGQQPLTAPKGGITCWKVVERRRGWPTSALYPMYYPFHSYETGKTYEQGCGLIITHGDQINTGYHSYAGLRRAEEIQTAYGKAWNKDLVVIECLIPEGAEYYEYRTANGTFDEYVSDKIKVTAILETERTTP